MCIIDQYSIVLLRSAFIELVPEYVRPAYLARLCCVFAAFPQFFQKVMLLAEQNPNGLPQPGSEAYETLKRTMLDMLMTTPAREAKTVATVLMLVPIETNISTPTNDSGTCCA